MRKGAISKEKKPAPKRPILNDADVSWIRRTVLSIVYSVVDLLKNPAYAIPLLLNVTGSVWFFLLIGQAGEYLVMDILRSSLNVYRIEPHSTNHQFSSLPIYSAGRVVGGGQSHIERSVVLIRGCRHILTDMSRYVDWYDSRTRRNSSLRAFEDLKNCSCCPKTGSCKIHNS
jgi:hypothetical protein